MVIFYPNIKMLKDDIIALTRVIDLDGYVLYNKFTYYVDLYL